MKKRNIIASLVVLASIIIIAPRCSKEGDAVFIPDLGAQWTNKADATNTFFFLVAKNNVNTSTFLGNENPIGGGVQFHFSGSFTNHNISFTYDNTSGVKSGLKYSGTIDNASKVMTLSGQTLGNLVLEKQ